MTSDEYSDDLAPADLRGRYADFKLLGAGGMGRVISAHDEHLNKRVAIKLLSRHLDSATAVMRFHQEAKAVSKLNNPHVVQVYDFGYTEGGEPFLVMEHVQGQSLESVLQKRGPLPISEALDIAIQLCTALEHAHANDIVHRDLKPANIMILTDGKVKVLDFGLARILSVEETDWRLTRPGSPMGSILYMSPEQIRGEEADQRSDVYSLGLVILKMVLGTLPFEGLHALKIVTDRLQQEPLTIPGDSSLHTVLNGVLLKAMNVDANERYQCMEDLRTALSEVVDQAKRIDAAEVAAIVASDLAAVKAAKKLSRVKLILAAMAVLLVAVGGVAAYLKSNVKEKPKIKESVKEVVVGEKVLTGDELEKKRKILLATKMIKDGRTTEYPNGTLALNCRTDFNEDDLKLLRGMPIVEFTIENNININSNSVKIMESWTGLEMLTLRGCNVNDSCIKSIRKMKHLYWLDLFGTHVTDTGILQIPAELKLRHLDIKELHEVTDKSLIYILKSFPNLEFLSISKTGISKEGYRKIPGFRNLTVLRIAGLNIGDEDLKVIAKMPLTALELNINPLTDNCVDTLTQMKTLTSINVEWCRLTNAGLKKLKQGLPGCHITPAKIIETNEQDAKDFVDMMD